MSEGVPQGDTAAPDLTVVPSGTGTGRATQAHISFRTSARPGSERVPWARQPYPKVLSEGVSAIESFRTPGSLLLFEAGNG